MNVVAKIPVRMNVAEFLAWCPEDGPAWQLIDGEPVAMAPPSRTHGAIQSEVGRLLGTHLLDIGSSCTVLTTPGVAPHLHAGQNVRIPDLVVTCSPDSDERLVKDPVLVIEILSPSNPAETWANVWTYATIPSVREVLVLASLEIEAAVLRRMPDGSWPESPTMIRSGDIALESIGYDGPLIGFYRTTRMAKAF